MLLGISLFTSSAFTSVVTSAGAGTKVVTLMSTLPSLTISAFSPVASIAPAGIANSTFTSGLSSTTSSGATSPGSSIARFDSLLSSTLVSSAAVIDTVSFGLSFVRARATVTTLRFSAFSAMTTDVFCERYPLEDASIL